MTIRIRNIELEDYNEYTELLKQLTIVGESNIENFHKFHNSLNNNHNVILILLDDKIVGCGTYLIEKKVIHNFGLVAHIEDVVVDSKCRGYGIGKKIMNKLIEIAQDRKCYKIILNCDIQNIIFYEKCGFIKKEYQMIKYLN